MVAGPMGSVRREQKYTPVLRYCGDHDSSMGLFHYSARAETTNLADALFLREHYGMSQCAACGDGLDFRTAARIASASPDLSRVITLLSTETLMLTPPHEGRRKWPMVYSGPLPRFSFASDIAGLPGSVLRTVAPRTGYSRRKYVESKPAAANAPVDRHARSGRMIS
jgi:hypothetical protein